MMQYDKPSMFPPKKSDKPTSQTQNKCIQNACPRGVPFDLSFLNLESVAPGARSLITWYIFYYCHIEIAPGLHKLAATCLCFALSSLALKLLWPTTNCAKRVVANFRAKDPETSWKRSSVVLPRAEFWLFISNQPLLSNPWFIIHEYWVTIRSLVTHLKSSTMGIISQIEAGHVRLGEKGRAECLSALLVEQTVAQKVVTSLQQRLDA